MKKDGFYHQPRWVNATFIAGCVPIILSRYIMPTGVSRPLVFVGILLLFLFVGVCNKWRSGAFFPRWAEAAQLRDRLETEKARRMTKEELPLLAAEVSAYDDQPRGLQTLSQAVRLIAAKLSINVGETWLEADHLQSNEAVEFRYRTTTVHVEMHDGKYRGASYDETQGDRSEWSEDVTSKLAWNIAGHPFDSKVFRHVYFSMPKPNRRI
jgi:hypothetical protein